MLDPGVPVTTLPKVVIVLSEGVEPAVATNVSACIAAGLATAVSGWSGHVLRDAAGFESAASSHVPITVLRGSPAVMNVLLTRLASHAKDADLRACLFPHYARAMHDAASYWVEHARRRHAGEDLLGLGLYGAPKLVTRLTGSLPLWR